MQLQDFWRIIIERRRIVLLAFFATVLTTLVASFFWPAKYEGTATLMLDYDSSNPMNMGVAISSGLTSVEYINTQIEITKSRRVAEGVVDILKLDKVPEIVAGYNEAKAGNTLFFWRKPLDQDIRAWLASNYLTQGLKVEPARDSRFIYIRFQSPDPAFSAAAANAFAKSYTDYNLELKVTPFRDAGKWFSEKLKDAKGYSDRASEQLREYQQKKGIVAQQGAIYDDAVQRLDQINRELASAKAKFYESRIVLKRSEDAKGNYESLPEVLANSFVQSLKGEKVRLETQLNELSAKAGSAHPQYIRLQLSLDTVNSKLKAEVQNIIKAIRQENTSAGQRVTQLENAVAGLKRESTSANVSRYEMDSLSRESEAYKQVYESVLKKYNETTIQGDINRTNVFIVDAAAPPTVKHSPKIALNLALSIFVGLFLGVGLAFFFDFLDDTVKGAEAMEREFGIPVLGTISNPVEI